MKSNPACSLKTGRLAKFDTVITCGQRGVQAVFVVFKLGIGYTFEQCITCTFCPSETLLIGFLAFYSVKYKYAEDFGRKRKGMLLL